MNRRSFFSIVAAAVVVPKALWGAVRPKLSVVVPRFSKAETDELILKLEEARDDSPIRVMDYTPPGGSKPMAPDWTYKDDLAGRLRVYRTAAPPKHLTEEELRRYFITGRWI